MSEEAEDQGPNTTSTLDPKRLLVDWANKQDGWVRRLVGHIVASQRPVSKEQTDELFELYLAEKGLRGTAPAIEPELPYPTDAAAAADALRLVKMSEVAGVNALSPGAAIDFCPGLTILYGENGTGKTGYARVLKRLSAVHDPEDIVPNIHARNGPAPTARIDFQLGAVEDSFVWNNEVGVSPFTRMSVFDSPAVNVRVDENLSYVFTPAEISLFGYVTAGIRGIQDRGARALREMASTNPFLRYFQRGTAIYQQVEALGAATDLQALTKLAILPERADEEMERLGRETAALRSDAAAGLLAAHREAVRTLRGLDTFAQAASGFDRDLYNEELSALAALRESYRRVREETFAPGDLLGPADDEWQRFVTAAARYQEHLGSTDYPHDGDSCVYCRQPLGAAALSLVRKYAAFLDNALGQQISEQERKVTERATVIASLRTSEVEGGLRSQREAGAAETAYAVGEELVAAVSVAQQQLSTGLRIETDTFDGLATTVRSEVVPLLAAHEAEVLALTQQLADRDAALRGAEVKLSALTATIELDRHLAEIRTFVQNAKQAATLDQVLKRISGLLRSLTDVSKIASEDLVNNDFQSRFEEECQALRTPTVRLEFIGREGKAQRRKTLTADYRLSQILSEGEQKVLALADFLAEARMGGSSAPIVFDDPVNSLDHRRLREVSDRIAALVRTRQVIVFTHDIWLATELLARFEKRRGECLYYMVSDDETTKAKGRVSIATGPRWDSMKALKKRVDKHLVDAASTYGVAQAALVEAAYGEMRSWCEVVVEEVIFGDVTRRYRANVMMGGLRNVRPDRMQAVIDVVEDLFNNACRFIPDHSQPLPTLGARPTLADAKSDWEKALEAVKQYRD
jgi:predicted ATPase